MRTPAGKECHFYYQNFHRGHSDQECRLVQNNPQSSEWKPSDCANCPVPNILLANSSPNLLLKGKIRKGFLGFNRHVEVQASCNKHYTTIPVPEVGCPQCAKEKPGFEELFGEK